MMQLADRVLTFLTVLALVVQFICFVLHIREYHHDSNKHQLKSPPVQVNQLILSSAEEVFLAAIVSIEGQNEARQVLTARARGPGEKAKKIENPVNSLSSSLTASHKKLRTQLPTMYGEDIVLGGIDRCAPFRASTSLFRRAAVAGLFNSGTNLLHRLLRVNCVMPMACPQDIKPKAMKAMMDRHECIGYPFQVPWGKHNPENYRRSAHVVPQLAHFNRSEILPIVVIKDPLSWMRSMCRVPYTVHFPRQGKCCPVPLNPKQFNSMNNTIFVRWRNNHIIHYSSLLDLWNTWYSDYWYSHEPRVFVRYEDLLFQPKRTTQSLCACVGGKFMHDEFDPIAEPAKSGRGHGGGEGTSRVQALEKYSSESIRYANFEATDFDFYNRSAHHDLTNFFRYIINPISAQFHLKSAAQGKQKFDGTASTHEQSCHQPYSRSAGNKRRIKRSARRR
mmetsp:Transcript_8999/g.13846  ORF Transcript_8999/g.13846 Transcript_8999/m.13846 type:complete len:448 (-) Transcript_8999:534-1877(-)